MSDQAKKTRLVSLDVFRGMTVAGMILVNNPGTWEAIHPPLQHAEWNGLTPTDLVFPFFLFIVGVAIPLALGKRIAEGVTAAVYWKILRRSAVIFLIGLFIAAFPYFDFSTLRIPGVLQRIAVCYLIVSLIFLHTNWKQQVAIGIGILLIYWLLITKIPVPGCEVTTMDDKACNLSAYLDRVILGVNHIWSLGKVYDPEGILSTLPAIVTALAGVLTGTWLKSSRSDLEKVGGIFFFGAVLFATGWFWNLFFPFNKALWTSSYVVMTAGLALSFLGFCYWLIDIKGYEKWSKPFVIFGVNALALYFGAEMAAKALYLIQVTGKDGNPTSLQSWIFENVFLPLAAPVNASLMYAVCFVLFWLFIMWILYRRKIFIRI
jgi:predicted acyltransferase